MDSNDALDSGALPGRARGWTRYLFIVGLVLYLGVVWYLGWQDVRDELLGANLALVLAAGALILSATWLRAVKWRYALGPGHDSTGLYFISKATGNWSPGRLGEFAPMILRRHRTPKIGAWIMFDRVLEIFVTLTLGLIGLATLGLLSGAQYAAVLIGTVAAGTLGMYLLTHRRFFLWCADRFKKDSIPHRFAMLFAAISGELFLFARKVPVALFLTAITKCADLWAVLLIFVSVGYRPGFGLIAAAKCALAIVSFVPITPTATGVPHVTQAWLMSEVADIPAEGLLVGIGIEVVVVSITFWTSFGLAASRIRAAAR